MSDEFTYAVRSVRVVFAEGALAELPAELARLRIERAMLVTTPGRSAAAAPEVRSLLGDGLAGAFDRAAVHVPAEVAEQAVAAFRGLDADGLVALGGGSAIGLGKIVARQTGASLLAVPTTYSGSEMTALWGITGGGVKHTGRDPVAAARTVLYDPGLTLALPPGTSAASGMNAIAHSVEALYAPDAGPPAGLLAAEAIRLLAGSLPAIVRHPGDPAARSAALRGAHLAGWALELTTMGLHHRLCHVLGGSFGLPHAGTHAALLPHVVAYNAPAAPRAMATVAGALGASDAWRGVVELARTLGVALTLRDLGLAEADLARAADLAAASTCPNPRPFSRDDVRRILEAAWAGA